MYNLEFFPEPGTPLDRTQGFQFGARIAYNSQVQTIAHIVAFWASADETIPECEERRILHDEMFWADQQTFEPVGVEFARYFYYSDRSGFDRLVIRVNVIEPGIEGRLFYCVQRVYMLVSN